MREPWRNNSVDFWADGMEPPYPGPNLEEMRRVVKTCHKEGMRIIPYFCLCELHPLSRVFLRRGPAWTRRHAPGAYTRWSHPGTDQLWGAEMCAASGWSRWLTGHIERIVREYDFDGFYLDGSGGGLCWRAEHGPAPHTLFEGHQRTLERLRRRFPDKIMVLHQISHTFNVAQLNISDHLVTFEEFGLSGPPPAAELPVSLRVASSCVSTAIVPGVFCPKDGEPLTPMLWFFSYKKGGEPEPSRRLLKEGIPQFLLNGNIPYTYYFNEKIMWGYNSCPDRLNDKDGIYALYRKLSRDDEFASGDFIPRDVCPYKCETAEVGVAAVVSARGTLLIIANTGGGKTPACEITKDGVKILSLGVMEPFEYRFEIVSGVRRR